MATTQQIASIDVEHADANGEQTEQVLRRDESVGRARRAEGTANSRARAAVQAALDKIRPTWCLGDYRIGVCNRVRFSAILCKVP